MTTVGIHHFITQVNKQQIIHINKSTLLNGIQISSHGLGTIF